MIQRVMKTTDLLPALIDINIKKIGDGEALHHRQVDMKGSEAPDDLSQFPRGFFRITAQWTTRKKCNVGIGTVVTGKRAPNLIQART